MTETNTALNEAIAKCDGIKARLETLREMSETKPILRLESITRPGGYLVLQSENGLIDCSVGTVIVSSGGNRYLRTDAQSYPWVNSYGARTASSDLWRSLVCADKRGVTFKYLGTI